MLFKVLPKNETQALLFILICSVIALSGAYLAEFIGFKPCILCIYQRIPYWCAIILCLLGIILKKNKNFLRYILLIICFALACEISVTFYHVLVEHHFIQETIQCSSALNLSDDPKIAMLQLYETPSSSCAHPEIVILGLSMAEWNLVYSIFITLIFFYSRSINVTR